MHMMGTSGGFHQALIYHMGLVKYSSKFAVSTLLIHSGNLETGNMSALSWGHKSQYVTLLILEELEIEWGEMWCTKSRVLV